MIHNLIYLVHFCCFITTSAGVEEEIDEMTDDLKVLQWSKHEKIDLQRVEDTVECFKQHAQVLLDFEIFKDDFLDSPFVIAFSEHLKRLVYVQNSASYTLIILKLISTDKNIQTDTEIRKFCDIALIEKSYRGYLGLLSDSVRFYFTNPKNNTDQYYKLVSRISNLNTADKARIMLADKMLLRGRVMEITFHFCIQGLLAKIVWDVNHFYDLFEYFSQEDSKYREEVMQYLSKIDPKFNPNIINDYCNGFYKIKTNLEHVYNEYTREIFDSNRLTIN